MKDKYIDGIKLSDNNVCYPQKSEIKFIKGINLVKGSIVITPSDGVVLDDKFISSFYSTYSDDIDKSIYCHLLINSLKGS
jgi:hypothetical protein